jgi:hypothetical protein
MVVRRVRHSRLGSIDKGDGGEVNTTFEVQSGRRTIGLREAPSAQAALLDHVRSLGCRDEEIIRLGASSISWRGATYRAQPAAAESDLAR